MTAIEGNVFATIDRYLILHFDLKKDGNEPRAAYKAIEDLEGYSPVRMSGSVFMVKVPEGVETFEFVLKFWDAMANATREKLMVGDIIFVHYSWHGDKLGALTQSVTGNENSLNRKPVLSMVDLFQRLTSAGA